jgi:DNA repair exonuclease SbcCD ATPase subunit
MASSNANITVPPYGHSDPIAWFKITDMILKESIQDEKNRCFIMYSHMPAVLQEKLYEIISNTDTVTINKLEEKLNNIFHVSEDERLHRFLQAPKRFDVIPSEALSIYRKILGGSLSSEIINPLLRLKWLETLPETIRIVIASCDAKMSLEELAQKADIMYAQQTISQRHFSSEHLSAAIQPTVSSFKKLEDQLEKVEQNFETLLKKNSALEMTLAKLSENVSQLLKSNAKQDYQSSGLRHNNKALPSNQSMYCYFHNRFGSKSYRCEQPCSWPTQGQVQGNA